MIESMKIAAIAFSALVLLACGSSPEDPREATLTARFGQTITIPGTNTQVTYADVSDSRCPATVTCVWAGDAAVLLQSGNDNVTLHTNPTSGPASAQLQGWTVTLIAVQPERTTTEPPAKTEYRAGLRFRR